MTFHSRAELRQLEPCELIEIVLELQDSLQEARDQIDSVESYARDRALALATRDGSKIPIKSGGEVDMDAILKDANAYLNFLIGKDA